MFKKSKVLKKSWAGLECNKESDLTIIQSQQNKKEFIDSTPRKWVGVEETSRAVKDPSPSFLRASTVKCTAKN